MKIIAWNCNGAFRKKYEDILMLNPDILIVSESENIEKLKIGQILPTPNDILWLGENTNKGICILSYSDYMFELLEDYNPRFKFVIPIVCKNEGTSFILFAVWTKENKLDKSAGYIGQVWGAINFYANLLDNNDSIIIGDFNSNKVWDYKRPKSNHSLVVNFLNSVNLESLYHKETKEQQGEETQPTFLLQKNINKPYHIDYCFVSKTVTSKKYKYSVPSFKDWLILSDHIPICAELEISSQGFRATNSLLELIASKLDYHGISKHPELSGVKKKLISHIKNGKREEKDRIKIVEMTEDLIQTINLMNKLKNAW